MTKKTVKIHTEKLIFNILVIGILASALLYAYFVSSSVLNIVQRKNIEANINIASSRVGDLESEYIFLTKNITLQYARTLGFSEPKDVAYVKTASYAARIDGHR